MFYGIALGKITSQHCDEKGPAWFSYKDIAVEALMLGEYPTILVTMPPPRIMCEAFFIAIILMTPLEQVVQGNIPDQPSFEYYTLELGISVDDSEYTVLGAWSGRTHLNLGEGPVAEPKTFLQAVSGCLLERHSMVEKK